MISQQFLINQKYLKVLILKSSNFDKYSQRNLKSAFFSAKREKSKREIDNFSEKQREKGEISPRGEISRRFAANFSAFRGENGHHDLGIENVFAAFRGETQTIMT